MRNILKTIVSRNLIKIGEDECVSEILWKLLTKSNDIHDVDIVIHGHARYIKLSAISPETLREYGIHQAIIQRAQTEDCGPSPNAGNEQNMAERFAESDVNLALHQIKDNRHEFIDYFVDEETINKKALTLALLRNIAPNVRDVKYLKSAFCFLKEKKILCDLPLKSFATFYKSLKWYCKIGWVNGCLKEVPQRKTKPVTI